MSEFQTYLIIGFNHISDLKAYDHIVFIVALCAPYPVKMWRSVFFLVTAFTVGHSITLALATFEIVLVSSKIIEMLIPITILVTCLTNVFFDKKIGGRDSYFLALFFGLVHGLGFSNYLRVLLGMEETIVMPLLSFNIGLELGQMMIVAIFAAVTFVTLRFLRTPHQHWNLFVSGAAAGISAMLLLGAQ